MKKENNVYLRISNSNNNLRVRFSKIEHTYVRCSSNCRCGYTEFSLTFYLRKTTARPSSSSASTFIRTYVYQNGSRMKFNKKNRKGDGRIKRSQLPARCSNYSCRVTRMIERELIDNSYSLLSVHVKKSNLLACKRT